MSRFMSAAYRALEEYVPGEQPRDRTYIKLNTNESPFPPSPATVAALDCEAIEQLCLYSDPESRALKEGLANLYGRRSSEVFVSNGSDDILNFAFMAFGKDHGVIFPDITYGFYKVFSELHHLDAEIVPLCEDFTLPKKRFENTGRMVVIANPNAPTGIALSRDEVERIVATNPDRIVLIDEAYVDFGAESALPLVEKYDNLLVVQTYSKSRSMAGARLGFAFANEAIIRDLEKIKYSTNPYAINRLTLRAGEMAVDERDYYRQNCRIIASNREFAEEELRRLGFFVTDSKANFIFAESPEIDGETLYRELRARGILVRYFGKGRIRNFNRITVGTRADMDALIEAVTEILDEKRNGGENRANG